MSLLTGAFEAFRDGPDRTAVIEDSGTWSRSEFMDEVTLTAAELESESARGPVGLLLPSGSQFLSVFLAAASLGRPACTLHPDWADPELEAAIADAGLSLVVTDRFELPPGVEMTASEAADTVSDDDSVFYIGFTSGTSGRPKPFRRRQRSWASSFAPAGELFAVNSGDQVFLPGSLQHSHFLFGAIFGLNRGASIRLFEQFDAETLASELEETTRGVLYLVPTMLVDLDGAGAEPFDGVHSVVVSGAKLESHHWEISRRLFPRALIGELYGASELSFVAVNTEGERPDDPGFVGRLFPGVEVEIRSAEDDAELQALPPGEPGLVYVRSPYLFDGYLEGAGTKSPIGPDGFMTVGDIGTLSSDGLSLSGRASNMLITGGKNVHPEEVETVLSGHPAVKECVVTGAPHQRWGEELVAFIVPAGEGGAGQAAGELRDFLRERVAAYKIPKRWFAVKSIPRTPMGKTDRTRERLLEGATELH